MAANKIFNTQPIALTLTLTTNLLNPPTATGGVNAGSSGNYIIVRRIHVVNKGTTANFSIWKGATGANAAGTELFNGQVVLANSVYSFPCQTRLDTTDFLVGGGSSTNLTISFEGEIGVAG